MVRIVTILALPMLILLAITGCGKQEQTSMKGEKMKTLVSKGTQASNFMPPSGGKMLLTKQVPEGTFENNKTAILDEAGAISVVSTEYGGAKWSPRRDLFLAARAKGANTAARQLAVIDTQGSIRIVADAPAGWHLNGWAWAPSGDSVVYAVSENIDFNKLMAVPKAEREERGGELEATRNQLRTVSLADLSNKLVLETTGGLELPANSWNANDKSLLVTSGDDSIKVDLATGQKETLVNPGSASLRSFLSDLGLSQAIRFVRSEPGWSPSGGLFAVAVFLEDEMVLPVIMDQKGRPLAAGDIGRSASTLRWARTADLLIYSTGWMAEPPPSGSQDRAFVKALRAPSWAGTTIAALPDPMLRRIWVSPNSSHVAISNNEAQERYSFYNLATKRQVKTIELPSLYEISDW